MLSVKQKKKKKERERLYKEWLQSLNLIVHPGAKLVLEGWLSWNPPWFFIFWISIWWVSNLRCGQLTMSAHTMLVWLSHAHLCFMFAYTKGQCPLLPCTPPRFFFFYAVHNRAIGSKMWRVPDSAIDALFWSPPPLWGGGMWCLHIWSGSGYR